jgi:hypothetical protein
MGPQRRRLTFRDWLDLALVLLVLAPYVSAQVPGGGIHHLKHSTMADSNNPNQIQPSDWNAELKIDTLGFGVMGPPTLTRDGDMWLEATGTPPTRTLAIKVQDAGVIRTVASITF